MQRELQVQLFGTFRVCGMGAELDAKRFKSPMMVKLMAYIFSHHDRNISVSELIDALWPNETSDDPVGALRNLIHRLRSVLKKVWGDDAKNFLITGNGFYSWNNSILLDMDVHNFEELCKEAEMCVQPSEKMDKYSQALALYQGTYMSGYGDIYWLVSTATFYNSLFLNTVKNYANLLEASGRYEEMEMILRKALAEESLDEKIHSLFIHSLIKQGKNKLAMEQYQRSVRILEENLGIGQSDCLQEIYTKMMRQDNEIAYQMDVVKAKLQEGYENGAFCCEYRVFKQIYQLEHRRMERLGMTVFLLMTTIDFNADDSTDYADAGHQEKRAHYMEILRGTLQKVLRSGDVITRYNQSQFLVMLPTCQYETAHKVIARIEKDFYSQPKTRKIQIRYGMGEVR